MIHTNEIEVKIEPTTKKIIELSRKYKEHNLSDIYFKTMANMNIDTLCNIIFELCDDKKAFDNKLEKVYDFVDSYIKEGKTYEDLFLEVGEAINDLGFFLKKMTKEELKKSMGNTFASINMEQTIANSTENILREIVQSEFSGIMTNEET